VTAIAIAANRGDVGGGEIMLVNLALAMCDLGHEVTVLVPEQPDELARLAESNGLTVTRLAGRGRAGYARALRRWHGDQRRVGRALLWCNGLLPAAATALRPDRVVHLHQLPTGSTRRVFSALALRRAIGVVVPSEHMRARLGRGVHVLPNWTQGRLEPREPVARDPDARVRIGYLGRVGRTKGVDVLGEACALLPPDLHDRVDLLVAGDDRFMPPEDRHAVDAALAGSGVPVTRLGWRSREEFFATTDLAVFPSVWAEPFGLVVAEAMESRCPVVVSDAGALPEVVGPDHPWIARRRDARALAETIALAARALPAADETARMRARWEERFSPAAGMRNLSALLRTLLGDGSP
jgi:glycosyltransferase involved in cell wall biosynthesis